jgi:hypothetical protein
LQAVKLKPKEFASFIQEAILDYPEMEHFDVEIADVDKIYGRSFPQPSSAISQASQMQKLRLE